MGIPSSCNVILLGLWALSSPQKQGDQKWLLRITSITNHFSQLATDSSFHLFFVYLSSENIINEYRNDINIQKRKYTWLFKYAKRHSLFQQIKMTVTYNFFTCQDDIDQKRNTVCLSYVEENNLTHSCETPERVTRKFLWKLKWLCLLS